MKKTLLTAGILLVSLCQAQAQFKISSEINGTPLESKVDPNLKGTRYFNENWVKGHVLQDDNTYYNNMYLKYDVIDDRPIFKREEIPYAFIKSIKEFQLTDPTSPSTPFVFRKGLPPIEKNTNQSYYQVLADGKAQLLKKKSKAIVESIQYGSTRKQEVIADSERYYLNNNGQMTRIKKDKNSLLKALGNKQQELQQFIKENQTDFKSDYDLINLLNYYNSI